VPSTSGPPLCGQIASITKISPFTLNRPYTRPSNSTSLAAPTGSSPRVASFTNLDIPSSPVASIPGVDSVAIATGVTRQAARPLYFIKPETVGKSGGRGGPLGTKGGGLPTLSK